MPKERKRGSRYVKSGRVLLTGRSMKSKDKSYGTDLSIQHNLELSADAIKLFDSDEHLQKIAELAAATLQIALTRKITEGTWTLEDIKSGGGLATTISQVLSDVPSSAKVKRNYDAELETMTDEEYAAEVDRLQRKLADRRATAASE